MLIFRDTNEFFKLDGDLLKTRTKYNFNVTHSNSEDQKKIYEFGKEMKYVIKQKSRKSYRNEYLI